MNVLENIARGIVSIEEALDRLKLSYKERFDRFSRAHPMIYRGYGRDDRVLLSGRVMEEDEAGFEPEPGLLDNVRNTIRRFETDEIRGATVRARLGDMELRTQASQEAFFHFEFRPAVPLEPGWHAVEVEVEASMASEDTGVQSGEVLIPPADADFVVVSDMDDTVIRSGAAAKPTLLRVMFMNDAHTRKPFEGVAALYRALVAGPSGSNRNPVFYLSRSPWNLYDMLTGFMEYHDVPKGPLLLRDAGLKKILGLEPDNYKRDTLDHLFEFYDLHRFLLIGDSGQSDPETYRDYALRWPERVAAIVIRDVTTPERDREVHAIAREVDEAGVPMILAANSREAAEELAGRGLIAHDAVPSVEAERASETGL